MKAQPIWWRQLLRIAGLLLLCTLALQLVFVGRIALMTVLDPQSTTFQRSEAWRLLVDKQQIAWAQDWVASDRIAVNLKRAVIASEDAGFVDHGGVDWAAAGPNTRPPVIAQADSQGRFFTMLLKIGRAHV